jgi:hypothetical protein
MNSIKTPSLPREKKRFLLPFLLCSLAFTSVAFGGTSLIRFQWDDLFHEFTNDPGSAAIEAEWIVYPDGLDTDNNFYLTSTTPHMVNGSEILFFYYDGNAVFKLFGGTTELFLDTTEAEPYIGTRVILGETYSVMRYRFINERTEGPEKVKLTCNNQAGTVATGSNGVSLPQSTIYVSSTYTFPSSGTIQVISSAGGQNITYTGTTSAGVSGTTSFTGCSGGTGTLTVGNELNRISGTQSAATHFKSTVYLWNYEMFAWDPFDEVEFDRADLCHDCVVCGGCGFWGPMFESNFSPCAAGFLPPIGVVDLLVSVDGGSFVHPDDGNSSFVETLNACGQDPPYERISYIENYQWIIKTPDK